MAERTLGELEELARRDPALDLFRAGRAAPRELLAVGLHPPLPLCGGRLLWGFPLLPAARAAGLTLLDCRLLEDQPPLRQLALALRLEARPGQYRWSEKEGFRAFARRAGFSLNELADLIEGRPDPRLEQRLDLFAGLPEALRRLVDEAALDLGAAESVRRLPEGAVTAAAVSRLSFSERRAFLTLLSELQLREALDPQAVCALARELLAAPRPLAALQQRRFPLRTELEHRWARLSEDLLAGSGVQLTPPPGFEGDAFEARFSFRSRQTLSRRLRALGRVERRFDELAGLLR